MKQQIKPNDMTIDEVKKEAKMLESYMDRLIADFNDRTGCRVIGFDEEIIRVSDCIPSLILFKPIISVK